MAHLNGNKQVMFMNGSAQSGYLNGAKVAGGSFTHTMIAGTHPSWEAGFNRTLEPFSGDLYPVMDLTGREIILLADSGSNLFGYRVVDPAHINGGWENLHVVGPGVDASVARVDAIYSGVDGFSYWLFAATNMGIVIGQTYRVTLTN